MQQRDEASNANETQCLTEQLWARNNYLLPCSNGTRHPMPMKPSVSQNSCEHETIICSHAAMGRGKMPMKPSVSQNSCGHETMIICSHAAMGRGI